jgi:hypothetical protein
MKLQGRREFWQGLLTAINEAPEDAVRIVTRQLQIVELDAERIAHGLGRLSQKERQQMGEVYEGKHSGDTTTPTETTGEPQAAVSASTRRRVPVQSWVKK